MSGWCVQLAAAATAEIPCGADLICPRASNSCCCWVSRHWAVWRAGSGGFNALQLVEGCGAGSAYCLPQCALLVVVHSPCPTVLGWPLPCALWCLVQDGNRSQGFNVWRVASAVSGVKAAPIPRLTSWATRHGLFGEGSSSLPQSLSVWDFFPVTAEMAISRTSILSCS